jgi:chromosomal replication initiator protein
MAATQDYWPLVLEVLKEQITPSNFKAWFSRLSFVETTNHGRKIVLGVPSSFNKNYIETKFKNQLKEAIGKYYPQVIHIDYQIQKIEEDLDQNSFEQEEIISSETDTDSGASKPLDSSDGLEKISTYLPKKNLNNLNPKYTFENFVVTANNELAANVAQSIVEEPGTLYNPVFIYSGVGLGKTHLLQSVGQKALEKKPGYNIKYVPSETFVNQYILSIQKKEVAKFREYYSAIDLLLIDDIQFIAGKEATQEIFFHIFNELHQQNKQIILTSDKEPSTLNGIEERLISRFSWGMVVDISKPDLEDRMAILQDKTERMQLKLQEYQITEIAKKVDSNVRDLEGVLNKIQARVRLMPDKPFTDQDLMKILGNEEARIELTKVNSSIASPDLILQAVCKLFSLNKQELLGNGRQKNVALARQIAMWLYKNELEFSYPYIGKLFGGRDHSTIIHGCRKIDDLYERDLKIREKISLLKNMLQQPA